MKTVSKTEWLERLSTGKGKLDFKRCAYWPDDSKLKGACTVIPNNLLVFIERGSMNVSINHKEFKLFEGSLVWIPPDSLREMRCNENIGKLSDYRLHFNVLSNNRKLSFSREPAIAKNAWSTHIFFQLLNRAYHNPFQFRNEYIKGLILSLSSVFFNLSERSSSTGKILSSKQQESIARYIHEHIEERVTSTALAKHNHLNNDYFSRLFKNTYGESARSYIVKERIRFSANLLLETDMSVKEIAFTLGYKDENLFCRQFKKIMGGSPGKYRLQ